MEYVQRELQNGVVLKAIGRIDLATADTFRDILLRAVAVQAAAKGNVFIDFGELDYISSAGLRSLMIASRSAKPAGVRIVIAAMQPVVKEIISISRFDLVFPCFDTLDEATDSLAALS